MPPLIENPRFARFFAKHSLRNERRGNAVLRAEMLAGLTGEVAEIGAGTGLNLRHYPETVTRILAVEPEPNMRARLAQAANERVELIDAVAEELPFEDASVDAVVIAAVLCSIGDAPRALAEVRRVLKPGGEVRFYEHVRARAWLHGRFQDLVAPLWARMMGGCRPNSDTLELFRANGFVIERWREFVFPAGVLVPVVGPRILGMATVSQPRRAGSS
ncbi:class I SAM-dependent methyltransferase [Amycolatopsis sp. NPDC059657]|uniref:class I SAM-dependent methyltransferase n=1 Tax=Amycolatopsis sp. NPDC059657 TaxID=3346899 RepID=UPI00366ED1D0